MKNTTNIELIDFLTKCTNTIAKRTDNKIHLNGNTEFRLQLEKSSLKNYIPKQVPALKKLNMITSSPYIFNFHDIAADLTWRSSPRTDFKAKFIAISSINEMLKLEDLVAGLLFMTPNQIYPEHQHNPQELYFVLSGKALWFYGRKEGYRYQKPGDIIYNNPNDLHGIKTEKESLLALYLLWGNQAKGYSC